MQKKQIRSAVNRDSGDSFHPELSVKNCVIAIGASTGGTTAIEEVLSRLGENSPPVVVTQHIAHGFSRAFAERLNLATVLNVQEAQDNMLLESGQVYVAPSDQHLLVIRRGTNLFCQLSDGPKMHHHRPSVDVMFSSLAESAGNHVAAILLTGMGVDGAQGMACLHAMGACTMVQDALSSVVWGMPAAALDAGGVDEVLPPAQIGDRVRALIEKHK